MKSIRTTLTGLVAVFALALASPLHAQTTPDGAAVREMRDLVTQPTADTQNRRAIQQFLARDDVRDVARSHGMDPERIEARAATLDSETASDVASRIGTLQDEGVLAGGDTFVISATTVIIVLLLLILIAVA